MIRRALLPWILLVVLLLLASCIADRSPLCQPGEAYCVVKSDGSCARGLMIQGVWADVFDSVRLQRDDEDNLLVC